MKKLPLIASISLYMYLTIPTSSLVAAPRDGFCDRAITEVKKDMLAQGNKVVSSRNEKISNTLWKSAPKGNSISLVFLGKPDWLRSSNKASKFSSRILSKCSQIKLVSFGPDQSDDIFYYGRVNGKVELFQTVSCGGFPKNTPKWGTICEPG
jgi:hypothetical protein